MSQQQSGMRSFFSADPTCCLGLLWFLLIDFGLCVVAKANTQLYRNPSRSGSHLVLEFQPLHSPIARRVLGISSSKNPRRPMMETIRTDALHGAFGASDILAWRSKEDQLNMGDLCHLLSPNYISFGLSYAMGLKQLCSIVLKGSQQEARDKRWHARFWTSMYGRSLESVPLLLSFFGVETTGEQPRTWLAPYTFKRTSVVSGEERANTTIPELMTSYDPEARQGQGCLSCSRNGSQPRSACVCVCVCARF